MFKGCQICRVVGKELWMLKFNRSYYRQARVIVPEIVIELIRLIYKVLAFTNTVIGTEFWDDRAYLTGWVKPRMHKHERKHCCRSPLAVHPPDREHTPPQHHLPHLFFPFHPPLSTPP